MRIVCASMGDGTDRGWYGLQHSNKFNIRRSKGCGSVKLLLETP